MGKTEDYVMNIRMLNVEINDILSGFNNNSNKLSNFPAQ